MEKDENNYKELRNNLSRYKSIFQYVYSNVFREIYCSTEKSGFNLKSNFHFIFKTNKGKKHQQINRVLLGKTQIITKRYITKTNSYEQKPIKIEDFNETEETEV